MLLKMPMVPTILLAHLTESDQRAYALADNAFAERSGWSKNLLWDEVTALFEDGYDLSILGFEEVKIESLLLLDSEALNSSGRCRGKRRQGRRKGHDAGERLLSDVQMKRGHQLVLGISALVPASLARTSAAPIADHGRIQAVLECGRHRPLCRCYDSGTGDGIQRDVCASADHPIAFHIRVERSCHMVCWREARRYNGRSLLPPPPR